MFVVRRVSSKPIGSGIVSGFECGNCLHVVKTCLLVFSCRENESLGVRDLMVYAQTFT